MLKETKTEETIVFFVTFLSLVAFQLGGPGPPAPPGYTYVLRHLVLLSQCNNNTIKLKSLSYSCSSHWYVSNFLNNLWYLSESTVSITWRLSFLV